MGLMTEEVYGLLDAGRSAQLRSEYLDKCFESLVNFAIDLSETRCELSRNKSRSYDARQSRADGGEDKFVEL